MSTTAKKNIYKILFFVVLIAFVGVTTMFLASNGDQSVSAKKFEKLKSEFETTQAIKQILEVIIEGDNQIISQSKPKEALAKYQSIQNEVGDDFKDLLLSRIDYAKQLIESSQDDEIARINLRTQIATQKDLIDSLSSHVDSLSRSQILESTITTKKVDSLKQELTDLNKALQRKEAKQVISFTNANGNLIHYLGEVQNGKANGGGIGIWNTGSIYKGQWKNNLRHGKGEFKWADGQVYNGEFKNDIRSGTGTYYWPSGEKYKGEFADNRMNGEGILYDPDGNKKYEGQWKNDKPKQ